MEEDEQSRIAMHVLANLTTAAQLNELQQWRRAKCVYFKKIERQEFDHTTKYFCMRIASGYEIELLHGILARINRREIKTTIQYFDELHKRNETIKKHNARAPASKAKELRIIPGFEMKVKVLVLTLRFLLRQIYSSFRVPYPVRFAKEQAKAAAKEDWEGLVRSFKNECIFSERFLSFAQRIVAPVAARTDARAYVNALVTEDASRRKDLFNILGSAAISMLAIGYVGYSFAVPRAEMQNLPMNILTPRPDAVHEVVRAYRESILLHNTRAEQRHEQCYGFIIIGDFTEDDLEEIERMLATRYNRQRMYDLGLRTIVVAVGQYSDRVDYASQTRFDEGAIRLFSGHASDIGIFEYELAHIRAQYYGQHEPHFWTEWERIAGPYNKVVTRHGSAARGDVAFVQHYVDSSDIMLPRFGYTRAYGGTDHHKDIGTMVQAMKKNPHLFARVQESFRVYQQKFAFLERYGFITKGEHERVRQIIDTARQTIHVTQ